MKRKLYYFCQLALLFLLLSCGSASLQKVQTRESASLFVFRSADGQPLSDSIQKPVKINPAAGTATYVCVDPLCAHDSADCPLYGIQSAVVSGNRLYFVSGAISMRQTGERSGRCEIRAYDMTDGTVRKLVSCEDGVMLIGAYGNAVYYAAAVYEEETDGFRYTLYRANDRTTIELPLAREYQSASGGVSTGDFPSIYAFDGERILWYAPGDEGYAFYATDLSGNILEVFPATNPYIMNGEYADGYAYYSILREKPETLKDTDAVMRWQYSREIWRSRLDGEEALRLCDDAAAWTIAGDTLYYTVLEDEPDFFTFNDMKETDWLGGKIYAMNTDGSGKRLLCTLDYNLDLHYTDTFLGAATEEGTTYLCLAYRDYVENHWYASGYEYGLSPNTLIVNTEAKSVAIAGLIE